MKITPSQIIMKRAKKINILLLCISTILSACSMKSLSTQQCLSGNWQAIGYNDGVAGRYPDYIDRHQQACAEVGVIPNFQAWQTGRQQGLMHYCTKANARRLGLEGLSFNAVCPAGQAARLQEIYNNYHQKYQRQKEIEEDERKLARYRSELDKLRQGDMLNFKTETEAREYMLKIQREIINLERLIQEKRSANDFY